jgi:hypothetical protein
VFLNLAGSWLEDVFGMQRFEAPTPEQLRVHQHRVGQQRVRGDGAPVGGALVNASVDASLDDQNLATLQVCASKTAYFIVQ